MSATDRPERAIEDISIDDKLLQLGGEPSGPPDPNWVWCLVRAENDPPRQVWVRYPAEEIPASALYVKSATPPVENESGVLVREKSSAGGSRTPSVQGDIKSFLRHVGEIADGRRAILHALKKSLDEHDHEAVLRHAKALVGR
jgi:hypothetical protein